MEGSTLTHGAWALAKHSLSSRNKYWCTLDGNGEFRDLICCFFFFFFFFWYYFSLCSFLLWLMGRWEDDHGTFPQNLRSIGDELRYPTGPSPTPRNVQGRWWDLLQPTWGPPNLYANGPTQGIYTWDTWCLVCVLRNCISHFLERPTTTFTLRTHGRNIMALLFLRLTASSRQPNSTGQDPPWTCPD